MLFRSICSATSEFLAAREFESIEKAATAAIIFWDELGKNIKEWAQVRDLKVTAGEIRREFVHSHGVLLQAFGRVGAALSASEKSTYQDLGKLKKINWSRSNARDWEGRVMIGGRLSKATNSVVLASALIKKNIGLDLSPDERKADAAFSKSRSK